MSAASDFLENKVLDHVLGNSTYTPAGTLYIGLFDNVSTATAVNLEAGTITDEISGSGYARKAIAFDASVDGTSESTATVTFDPATGDWGTVTHLAIMDALTTGNVLFWGPLTVSKLIETGDTMQFVANNVTISLA